MKKLKELAIRIWNDESGQGATEYILLLVVVVGLAVVFRGRITEVVEAKIEQLGSSIGSFGN